MRILHVVVFSMVIAAWSAMPVSAQTTDYATWGVQFGGGASYGTIPKGSTRSTEGTFSGGVFAVMPMGLGFKFQPEVKYDSRKVTIQGATTELGYLSVPLLLRNELFGIFITQGVGLNFLVRSELFGIDIKDATASPDISIILGVGKRVGRVSVEGRSDTGLRTLQKDVNSGVRLRAITGVVSIYFKE